MNVRQLIELLEGEPNQEREVVMAKDSEGNSYSPLHGSWCGRYRADTTWCGEVGLEGLDDEMRVRGYSDADVMTDGVPALILTPVHTAEQRGTPLLQPFPTPSECERCGFLLNRNGTCPNSECNHRKLEQMK